VREGGGESGSVAICKPQVEVQFLSPAPTFQRFDGIEQVKGNEKGND
jgi:hypothetical protein